MNLLFGEIIDREQSLVALKALRTTVAETLKHARPPAQTVITACGRLKEALDPAQYLPILTRVGLSERAAWRQIAEAKAMLDPAYLKQRIARELGPACFEPETYLPHDKTEAVNERWQPLGVLLHIAAGNMEALPAFTVIEGLLTGNINLLKLPAGEDGLSVLLLRELIRLAPELAAYIYVFDYPSEETDLIVKMAEAADAIIVWGSDAAVSAVRKLAKPNTRLIEWGHKLSFAYATTACAEEELYALALHICRTNQLLCSSCQGIFLDTGDEAEAQEFSKRFVFALEQAAKEEPHTLDTAMQAHLTLKLRTQALLITFEGGWLYEGVGASVQYCTDEALTTSLQFRNCWVRRLPRERLLEALFPYRGYLQTAGLLCAEEEREELSNLLVRAGITRVTRAGRMSDAYCGAAHDGEYALRKYMKRVSFE